MKGFLRRRAVAEVETVVLDGPTLAEICHRQLTPAECREVIAAAHADLERFTEWLTRLMRDCSSERD